MQNESKHSEMGPVRQNPIQRTVSMFICVCIALCTIVAHNIAQSRPDSFPPLPSRRSPQLRWCLLGEGGSRKRCKIGSKLVLITNRKLYMSFRLVPKWVILNDLERRNGRYFALFHRIFAYDVVVKQLLGLPRFQNLLLIGYDHIKKQLFSDYLDKTNWYSVWWALVHRWLIMCIG